MKDLSIVIFESCIEEAMDWKTMGKGAAIGAGVGAGAGLLKYAWDRRKLKKELNACRDDKCREKVMEELKKLRLKGVGQGLALGAAGGVIGAAGGKIKSDVDAHKKIAEKQNNAAYKEKFVKDRDAAVKKGDELTNKIKNDIQNLENRKTKILQNIDQDVQKKIDIIKEIKKLEMQKDNLENTKFVRDDLEILDNKNRLQMKKDRIDSIYSAIRKLKTQLNDLHSKESINNDRRSQLDDINIELNKKKSYFKHQ